MALNGWESWSKYVIEELKQLNSKVDCLDTRLQEVRIEIATLKVKSGVWGLLGGLIPVIIVIALWLLRGK